MQRTEHGASDALTRAGTVPGDTHAVEDAWKLLESADEVCAAPVVSQAVERMAAEITARLVGKQPLVLAVMGGAVVFTGQLLPRCAFRSTSTTSTSPATAGERGAARSVARRAEGDGRGRVVLVLDDILDEGTTLAAIRQRILEGGAAACYCAVLADKELGRTKPITADFVGVRVPDRYVFGFGMDVHGLWRNLPAIYALRSN